MKFIIIIVSFICVTHLFSQDLELEWSSYIGTSKNDEITSIEFDSEGNIYIVGFTESKNYPTSNNAFQKNNNGSYDIFITKLDMDLNVLWSTFLGGSGRELSQSFEISENYIWIVGETLSNDYPVTTNAIVPFFSGGSGDIIISKLSLDGELLFSTYYGGGSYDYAADVAIDKQGSAWVTGRTNSSSMKVTNNAIKKSNSGGYDSYILKITNSGVLEYGSFIGGSRSDFGLTIDYSDALEQVTIAGFTDSQDFRITNDALQNNKFGGQDSYDNYISTFDLNGKLVWSSFLGGTGNDFPLNIEYDNSGNLYVHNYTTSYNLFTMSESAQRTLSGRSDNYIFKLNLDKTIEWSTYLGGSNDDGANNILHKFGDMFIDDFNNVYIFGFTNSNDFPTTPDSEFTRKGSQNDCFITKFDNSGNIILSSYFGGSQEDQGRSISINNNKIYVVGFTNSSDFPVTDNAPNKNSLGGKDGFLSIFGNNSFCSNVFDSESGFKNIDFITNRNIKDDTKVSLTADVPFDLGYLFYGDFVNVNQGFTTDFSFIVSEGKRKVIVEELKETQVMYDKSAPGADGIALVLVGEYPNFKGRDGGGIGYSGYKNAMAIEIDMYENSNYDDPNGNHLAIQIHHDGYLSTKHTPERNLFITDNIIEIASDSSQVYHCRVEYNNRVLRVYLDSTGKFETPVAEIQDLDFNEYLNLDYHTNAFIGLTSSTGKEVERHDITHWDLCTNSGQAFTTGIEDITPDYALFPNPTDGEFTIDFENDLHGLLDVTVTDLLGRVVISKSIYTQKGRVNLNIASLIDGVYYVNISSDGELIHSAKLIKK